MADHEIQSRLLKGIEEPSVKYILVRPSWYDKVILVLAMLMALTIMVSIVYLTNLGSGNRDRLEREKTILCYSIAKHDEPLPPACAP